MANYPQQIADFILDTIFPAKCIGCGLLSPLYLCQTCVKLISVNEKHECIGCRLQSKLGETCYECKKTFYIDRLLVVSDYKNPILEKTLKTLKYKFISDLAGALTPAVKKYLIHLGRKNLSLPSENPLIIPIPLHFRRMNYRGFNQSELLARILSGILLLEIDTSLLKKSRETKPQAETDTKEQRLANVIDAFYVSSERSLNGRSVLLVDDVCTTGATLDQAAKVLKQSGAKNVTGFVIARG